MSKPTFLQKAKTNWLSILFLIGVITSIITMYNNVDTYIKNKVNIQVSTKIRAHDIEVKHSRDSVLKFINESLLIPLERQVKCNSFRIDQTIQGLNAEFDPFVYKVTRLYKSNPNYAGYVQIWHIIESDDHHWKIYKAEYNPTYDTYEYYDIDKHKKIKID